MKGGREGEEIAVGRVCSERNGERADTKGQPSAGMMGGHRCGSWKDKVL